jgi:hypothetical protein
MSSTQSAEHYKNAGPASSSQDLKLDLDFDKGMA